MNATIHIRKEDVDKWKDLKNKSEFVHNALIAMNDSKILRTPELHKQFDEVTKPIKTPKDVVNILQERRNEISAALNNQPVPKSFSARKKK